MAKRNNPSEEDKKVKKLIAQYEAMKKENKSIYLDSDQLVDIANYYNKLQKLEKAEEIITYGLSIHPGDTDLMLQQAYLYLNQEQGDKAEEVAQQISNPYDGNVILLKAGLALNRKEWEEAEAILDELPADIAKSYEVIHAVCYLYLEAGRPGEAISWLQKGLEDYNDQEEFLATAATCYEMQGQRERAIFFYNKALDKNPYGAQYWTGIAKCHLIDCEFEESLKAADMGITADENYLEAYVIKAHCLSHFGEAEEAVENYQKGFKSDLLTPGSSYNFMGIAFVDAEKWEKAIPYFVQALKYLKHPDEKTQDLFIEVCNNLVICHVKLGKIREAYKYIRKSKKVNPEHIPTLILEGRVYADDWKPEYAYSTWDSILAVDSSIHNLQVIGEHATESQLLSFAIRCYETIKEMEPDHPRVDKALIMLSIALCDHEKFSKYNALAKEPINLRELVKKIETMNPDIPDQLDNLHAFLREYEAYEKNKSKGKSKKKL